MVIRQISASDTLPLRQSVLRPTLPISSSQFPKDLDPKAAHFGVWVREGGGVEGEEKLIAVGSVYPEEFPEGFPGTAENIPAGGWRLRGMATNPAFRSQGAGALLLKACLDHAKANGASLVWAHARTGAVEFYLRHGMRLASDIYELPGISTHYLMQIDF